MLCVRVDVCVCVRVCARVCVGYGRELGLLHLLQQPLDDWQRECQRLACARSRLGDQVAALGVCRDKRKSESRQIRNTKE